eukprot:1161165-Pelagomonas_calceolata.AAC.2
MLGSLLDIPTLMPAGHPHTHAIRVWLAALLNLILCLALLLLGRLQGLPPIMPTAGQGPHPPTPIDWPALLAEVTEAGAAVPEVDWITPGGRACP